MPEQIDIVRLVRAIVKSSIDEAIHRPRVTRTLSGNVEDLDSDLDVVFVRMDGETMGTDPRESDNYEAPGIIPTVRNGEAFIDEQVRVTYEGASGASATRTSIENVIVLPYGAEDTQHIVLDGNTGSISFFDAAGALAGQLTPDNWIAGPETGPHVQIDPFGGIRVYAGENMLAALVNAMGLQVRDPVSGLVQAALSQAGLQLRAVNGNTITVVPDQSGNVVAPKWAATAALNPGTTMDTPPVVAFTLDDLELRYVSAWNSTAITPSSFTPPASYTEVYDETDTSDDQTLAVTMASRHPGAPGATRTFENALSNFQFDNGHTVLLRSDGVTPPSVRSFITDYSVHTGTLISTSLAPPAGVQADDVMVACVSMGNDGGSVPLSWSTPEGWVFLGAVFQIQSGNRTLASGMWYKIATADDVALEAAAGTYDISITFGAPATSVKKLHASITAVQDVEVLQGGADILFEPASRCRVHATVNSNFVIGTPKLIDFNVKDYDPGDCYDLASNTYTVPQSGPYKYAWRLITGGPVSLGDRFSTELQVNGVAVTEGTDIVTPGTARVTLTGEDVVDLNAGDTVQVFAEHVSGPAGAQAINGLGSASVYFHIQRDLST
jgi:hypothetical protein